MELIKNCKVHGVVEGEIYTDGCKYKYLACLLCRKEASVKYIKSHRLRYLLGKAKRRSKWEFDIDEGYLQELFDRQKGLCALSKIQMGDESSIDRIDSSQGYIKGNIQLILLDINRMKRDLPQNKFIQYCKEIAGNN